MPTIVVVGRGLANGVIELRDRRSGEQTEVLLTTRSARSWPRCTAAPAGLRPSFAGLSALTLGADPRRLRGRLG